MAAEPIFLDTSFLVAAMIDAHPGHSASFAYLGELDDERGRDLPDIDEIVERRRAPWRP